MRALIVDGQICELKRHASKGDFWLEAPKGWRACRMINGKPCGCTVAWVREDGRCPCAGSEPIETHPLALVATEDGRE
jgi:hypothetical protein